MSKRRHLTAKRRKTLRLALELAVQWERTYIDSLGGSTLYNGERDLAHQNIRDFRVLHAILRDETTS